MVLSELALLTLSLNLSMNPSSADIQKYQNLSQDDQVKVQQLIEQRDEVPGAIEQLKVQASQKDLKGVNESPTRECTTQE